MLDPYIRPLIDPPLHHIGKLLHRLGISANTVTFIGFLIGVGAWAALAYQYYIAALILILINRLFDGLDGALARHHGLSDLGGFLDIVLDMIFYAGVIFFFAVGKPEMALAACFLLFCFMGTSSSFLAYAVLAEKKKITTQQRGKKSLYYIGGLTEGSETIILLISICIFPMHFEWLCYGFGAACLFTIAGRITMAFQQSNGSSDNL